MSTAAEIHEQAVITLQTARHDLENIADQIENFVIEVDGDAHDHANDLLRAMGLLEDVLSDGLDAAI